MPVKNPPSVTKHNALVAASYKLTLNEQRLVLAFISKIDPRKPLSKNCVFEITAKEFAERYGISLKKSYEELEEASKGLYEQDIKTYDGKCKERFRWVYSVKYHEGEGRVTLGFSPSVLQYLTMIRGEHTRYYLGKISKLKSVYSIRLFEFLMRFKATGKFFIALDRFREALGLKTEYKRFFDLKRVVIDRAVKELNEKSDFVITWKHTKGANDKVKQLEFVFRESKVVTEDLAL